MIGIWQLVLIVIFCIVVFGAGKIPRVMGDIGSGIRAFKKALIDDKDDSPSKKKKITHKRSKNNPTLRRKKVNKK